MRRRRAARASSFSTDAASAPLPAPNSTIVATRGGHEDRLELPGNRGAVERRQLGAGDEVSGPAELARAGDVIPERRRIERKLHVMRKRYETAAPRDLAANVADEPRAVFLCVGIGRRQRRIGHSQGGPGMVRVRVPTVLDCMSLVDRQVTKGAAWKAGSF